MYSMRKCRFEIRLERVQRTRERIETGAVAPDALDRLGSFSGEDRATAGVDEPHGFAAPSQHTETAVGQVRKVLRQFTRSRGPSAFKGRQAPRAIRGLQPCFGDQ